MKTVYFAHGMWDYGTDKERAELNSIDMWMRFKPFKESKWRVFNPAHPGFQPLWEQHGMGFFDKILPTLDAVAFTTHEGKVGAGVHYEVKTALKVGIPCYHLTDDGDGQWLTLVKKVPSMLSRSESRKLKEKSRQSYVKQYMRRQ